MLGELWRDELEGALTRGVLGRDDLDGDLTLVPGRDGFEILGVDGLRVPVEDGRLTVVGGRLTEFLLCPLDRCIELLGMTTGRLDVDDVEGRAGVPLLVVVGVDGDWFTRTRLRDPEGRLTLDGDLVEVEGDTEDEGAVLRLPEEGAARTPEFDVELGETRFDGLDWTA
jgi:hypothetical protein